MNAPLRTTCPYCGVGCGLTVDKDGILAGDRDHPANFGRLCSKGAALKDTLGLDDRLLAPTIHGKSVSWDAALELIASRFARTMREHGPDSTAFYVSGQFLTEDYYVANKLMKGFIGSANIDTNSRLCMASSVAGHLRAFGEDVVPGCYEDLDETDLAVMVGSNMAWCHPVLYQRLVAARRKRGTKLVVIDPRRTATCDTADLHLPLKAGSDAPLFNGLLAYLADAGAINHRWIERHASGFDEALAAARGGAASLDDVAAACAIPAHDLRRFYELFARTERVVTLYSQGVNQSDVGTDKVNAIINAHLATGRIGRPGMGPLSLTGQPNAMGGREVGGLANQLAAHMNFDDPADIDRVRRFWRAPNIATRPGLKAVEMFEAVHDGRIKAIWIAATNPAVSMPRAGRVRAALERCPFVVVTDCWPTDTTALADVVLPAAAWAEKDGVVTNSERRMSRQRAFRAPPGQAKPDWWMFAQVGRRMGWPESFRYANAASIFREHAALSAFENDGGRLFDIGALADLDDESYDRLAPAQWPRPKSAAGRSPPRLFARGGFMTPHGRARMTPTPAVARAPDALRPLRLNTGRVRDQWHTMTRTGRVAHLMAHAPEPLLEIHSGDAAARGLADGALARIDSEHGSIALRVRVTDRQRVGETFAPMHWTDQFCSSGPVDRLVAGETDPISGQPDLKGAAVRVVALPTLWRGLLMRRSAANGPLAEGVYWAKTPLRSGWAFELAGWRPLHEIITSEAKLREWLEVPGIGEFVAYSDPKRSVFRYAGFVDARLEACLFLTDADAQLPAREEIAGLLGEELAPRQRVAVLAARALDRAAPNDKPVCACFGVGERTLTKAIREQGLANVGDIGAALRAGTNCGSCIPELTALLQDAARERA
ncbi:MAG: molybdopterin-dependent oxidoreductase, partial [Roseiarcus sp.]